MIYLLLINRKWAYKPRNDEDFYGVAFYVEVVKNALPSRLIYCHYAIFNVFFIAVKIY